MAESPYRPNISLLWLWLRGWITGSLLKSEKLLGQRIHTPSESLSYFPSLFPGVNTQMTAFV